MPIYTIGYQRLHAADLRRVMDVLGCDVLIDVRSVPSSRRPGFSRRALTDALTGRYEWRGDVLGGRGHGPQLSALRALLDDSRTVLVMCQEEAPGDCHRHYAIGLPLARMGATVTHVYRDELIEANELQRAMDEDRDYECEVLPSLA
jgi:uncharacterized protein (DUF488 family)